MPKPERLSQPGFVALLGSTAPITTRPLVGPRE
eukprot:COSAG01_NODE_19415_length_1010_cov_3.239297_1_plen_32_part_01